MILKTIFFDIGNVLFFFSHEKMCLQLASCMRVPVDQVRCALFQDTLMQEYETGRVSTEDVYRFFQKQTPHPFSLDAFLQAASDIFIPNTALWPLIHELKQQNFRLVLLSNISECHFNTLYTRYPILQIFHDKTLSFEVGAMKPDERIFADALTKALCSPNECFYTDDVPHFVEAGRKAGIDAEVFHGTSQLKEALARRGVSLSLPE